MASVGNYRARAELRKQPRRQFHYQASVLVSKNGPPIACEIADISHTGARIVLANELELPDRFILMLNANGDARRVCRVVWRDGVTIGVEFPEAQS